MIPAEELKEILHVGIRAISTCNHQPWRFRIHEDELHVYILRTKNFFLKLEGNTWIELGTLLENMSIAATVKGYQLNYHLQECCGLDEPSAIVTFEPCEAKAVDIESLLRRCTNRASFSQEPLAKDVVESIYHACDLPHIAVQILTKRKKDQCAQILNGLENVRLGNRLMLEEVVPYIRTDVNEIEKERDRLDVRAMELSNSAIGLIQYAKKNPKIASLIYLWLKRLGLVSKNAFKKKLVQSGALIAFILERRDQETYVNLGRIAQRILNTLTAQNVQTYTLVSGLYLLDLLKENLEIYSKEEQNLLLRHQYDLQSLFDFTDRRIALFIRAGYAAPPKIRTLRKNVDELMVDERSPIFKNVSMSH